MPFTQRVYITSADILSSLRAVLPVQALTSEKDIITMVLREGWLARLPQLDSASCFPCLQSGGSPEGVWSGNTPWLVQSLKSPGKARRHRYSRYKTQAVSCGSAAPYEQANFAEQDDPQLAPEAYSTLATHTQSDSQVVQRLQRGP